MNELEHKFKHQSLGDRQSRLTTAELTLLVEQLLKERAMRNMALRPFAEFGKRLLDGRSHVPPRGHWYGLDSGCPTEANLDVEHFEEAIELVDGKPFVRPSKEETVKLMRKEREKRAKPEVSGYTTLSTFDERRARLGEIGPVGNTD